MVEDSLRTVEMTTLRVGCRCVYEPVCTRPKAIQERNHARTCKYFECRNMDARMGVLLGRAVCLPLLLRISSRRQALAYCTIFYGMQAGRFTLKLGETNEKRTTE